MKEFYEVEQHLTRELFKAKMHIIQTQLEDCFPEIKGMSDEDSVKALLKLKVSITECFPSAGESFWIIMQYGKIIQQFKIKFQYDRV